VPRLLQQRTHFAPPIRTAPRAMNQDVRRHVSQRTLPADAAYRESS
jgi:hypothetical protein